MFFLMSFLLRRLAQAVVILFFVTFIIFTILRLVPGDPARLVLGPLATQEVVEVMTVRMGLDKPIVVQYFHYVWEVLKGDMGSSFIRPKSGMSGSMTLSDQITLDNIDEASKKLDKAPVLSLILERLPKTLYLAGMTLAFALIISLPIGILAALYKGRLPDTIAVWLGSFMVSIPNFWLAVVLTLLVSIRWGWLPATGYEGPRHIILPAFVLAIELAPVLIRIITISLAGAINEGYMAVGQMRGLSRSRMIWKHASRNASVPLLNVIGIQMGVLLGGVIIIEFVFNYPGLGHLIINAILQRDFPVIQGVAIFIGIVFVVANIVVDYVCSLIDPRLQY
jgi:peptide/nickel transport system permease protein